MLKRHPITIQWRRGFGYRFSSICIWVSKTSLRVLFSGHTAHNCHLSFTRSCDLFSFWLWYPSLPHKPLSEPVMARLAYAYTPLDPNDLILNDLSRNIVCCTFKYRCKLILACWLNYCFQYCRFLRVIPRCLARVQTFRETTLAYLKSWLRLFAYL